MSDYLVHRGRERARFRHDTFASTENKAKALDILKQCEGVVGLKPGEKSIMVLFEPEANIDNMRQLLEEAFPELVAPPALEPVRPQKAAKAAPAGKNEWRKRELETLLGAGVATVGFIAIGMKHVHAWAGGIFTLLAAHHVWERRSRL